MLKSQIKSEWEDGSTYEFDVGETHIMLCHQTDQRGMHRIAMVDDTGTVVSHGYPAIHQHPAFATFGVHNFIALSDYYSDIRSGVVYLIHTGEMATPPQLRIEKREKVNEKKDDGPWMGWYITGVEAEPYGGDLVELRVRLEHTNGEREEISETLNPGIGDIDEVGADEYGGIGKNQQSIVLTATSSDGGDGEESRVELQVEVDYKTGKFKDSNTYEWDPC